PANPTGIVQDTDALARIVDDARALGAVVASDECYAELGWGKWEEHPIPSVLDHRVSGDDPGGLLSVYSLSKQSNMPGYRGAFVAGDKKLIAALINLRSHTGMVVLRPIQSAMIAALADDDHVRQQKASYRNRRTQFHSPIDAAGLAVEYTWARLCLPICGANFTRPTAQDSCELIYRLSHAGSRVGS